MKLLVLTMEGFQEIEMQGFLGSLNRSEKLEKITYWNPDNQSEVFGSNKIGSIKTIFNDINVNDYDAIFVPGGAACIALRKNKRAIDLIKEFINHNKWIFAICDGPNALFDNGIFIDKNYSSYPIENIKNVSGKNRNQNYVSVDGKYITGKCPSAAVDLGIKVIEVLYGKELSQKAYNVLYGIE